MDSAVTRAFFMPPSSRLRRIAAEAQRRGKGIGNSISPPALQAKPAPSRWGRAAILCYEGRDDGRDADLSGAKVAPSGRCWRPGLSCGSAALRLRGRIRRRREPPRLRAAATHIETENLRGLCGLCDEKGKRRISNSISPPALQAKPAPSRCDACGYFFAGLVAMPTSAEQRSLQALVASVFEGEFFVGGFADQVDEELYVRIRWEAAVESEVEDGSQIFRSELGR